MKYEEWREDVDEEEAAFLERQEQAHANYRMERLYAAVGTFEPYWAGNVKFFNAKFWQDWELKKA